MRVMQIPKLKGNGCFDVMLHANRSAACLPTSHCPNPAEVCRAYEGRGKLRQIVDEVRDRREIGARSARDRGEIAA